MLMAHIKKNLWHFNLDLELELDSRIVVLWGPSGAGKTTLLHCLAGLRRPSAGFIRLNDRTLYSSEDKIDLPARLRKIGYLFQDYALFPHMTVKQNVIYGVRCKGSGAVCQWDHLAEVLNSFGVGHLVDRYPHQLSGGERQRVALSRALAVQPDLLLLDEPFSALDKDTKMKLRQELKDLHRLWQIPFLLVSHDEDDASFLGDSIISIQKGKVLAGSVKRTGRR